MFSLLSIILAFFAGILGCLIGGTQTFICTGFVGIVITILSQCQVDVSFMNEFVSNHLFLPCIIFNGAAFATAYASQNHSLRGVETSRSLAFTNDYKVLLVGGIAGVLGYLIFAFENYFHFPIDTGAVSVILVGVLGRILFNQENTYNKDNLLYLKSAHMSFWVYQMIIGLSVSCVMAFFAKETGLYTIGFSISALSLIFALTDPAFPATHHTTLVTGYAMMQTGSMLLAVLFGLLAHFIGLIFGMIFNTDCGTHVDPPAIAIALLSFILFVFF
ncbi:MAG: hypothetical protein ACI4SR_06185 [Faecalibacillus sp.]